MIWVFLFVILAMTDGTADAQKPLPFGTFEECSEMGMAVEAALKHQPAIKYVLWSCEGFDFSGLDGRGA